MVLTLKVILAISVLLGITSTTPLQLMAKFKRNALMRDDFPVEGTLKALYGNITKANNLKACQQMLITKVDFHCDFNSTCSGCRETFCSVNKALQDLSRTNCSHIIPIFRIPKPMTTVNCTVPSVPPGKIPLGTFSSGLIDFIGTAILKCTKKDRT